MEVRFDLTIRKMIWLEECTKEFVGSFYEEYFYNVFFLGIRIGCVPWQEDTDEIIDEYEEILGRKLLKLLDLNPETEDN